MYWPASAALSQHPQRSSYSLPAVQGSVQEKSWGKVGKDEAQGILQRDNAVSGKGGIRQSYKVYCKKQYRAGT